MKFGYPPDKPAVQEVCFPHARDEPYFGTLQRGYSLCSPARAGMSPVRTWKYAPSECAPRTRRDNPLDQTERHPVGSCSALARDG